MSHKVICTAGHIDHGKTSLIKALTGMDTDRLAEEKLRGITIDLGFGYYGADHTIIDLPGHEKFIRNMAAGAATVDFAILVIAADDGPMPQTYEHQDILNLLGIKHGMVALTKADLVEEDWLELISEEIREKLLGTFLENAPIVILDSISGRGIDEFRTVFERELSKITEEKKREEFRLPVDRSFTIKGFGTVVTGTVISGKVALKDSVELLPSGKILKVRGIQTHGEDRGEAFSGDRAALNLSGAEKDEISRGDIIAKPGFLKPSFRWDCKITLLKSSLPLKHRQRVRFHIGTAEILGRIHLLNENFLEPGGQAFVQLELEESVAALRGDRFVFRTYSPQITIGGGVILTGANEKHKRRQKNLNDLLAALSSGDESLIIKQILKNKGMTGAHEEEILSGGSIEKNVFSDIAEKLIAEGEILFSKSGAKNWYNLSECFEELKAKITAIIGEFHAKNPSKDGMSLAQLKSGLFLGMETPFIESAAVELTAEGKLNLKNSRYSLNSHSITLDARQSELCEKIMKIINDVGFATLKAYTITETIAINIEETLDILIILESLEKIIRLDKDTVISVRAFNEIIVKLKDLEAQEGQIETATANNFIGSGRRSIVAILDYTDKTGITERDGDVRKFK